MNKSKMCTTEEHDSSYPNIMCINLIKGRPTILHKYNIACIAQTQKVDVKRDCTNHISGILLYTQVSE